jgi:mannose/fructose/N-acetylgalactosamine-specific phosphotransferase system component IIB
MNTVWLRIDDRLVHGQVVAGWLPHLKADRIVIVSDAAAGDETQQDLMRLSLPEALAFEVWSLQQAGPKAASLMREGGRCTLVLVPSPSEALFLLEAGLQVPSVNVGGLHHSVGKVQLGRAIFLAEKDREDLKSIAARGVKLDARAVPSERGLELEPMLGA